MALELRNGQLYYYQSERCGRTVRRRYVAAGAFAKTCAEFDVLTRQERQIKADIAADRIERERRRTEKLRRLLTRAEERVAQALRAAGWHQHKREWRRKRGEPMTTTNERLPWLGPALRERAGVLDDDTSAKAAKGNRSVVPAVADYLANPAAVALWGDAGRRLLHEWVLLHAGKCVTTEQALLRHAAELRDRLTGPEPDALVQLVAERVVLAWVAVNHYETQYIRQQDKMIIPHHKFFLARIELAHKNLLAAARTLAKVRRTKLPKVLALVNVSPPAEPAEALLGKAE